MLQVRIRDKNEQIERERQLYVLRQESLIKRGVSEEHAALLPTDSADPLPSPIQRDLQATREQALRQEISAKRQRAREAFQEPWLQATERELSECNITLTSVRARSPKKDVDGIVHRGVAGQTKESPLQLGHSHVRDCIGREETVVLCRRPFEERGP